MTASLSLLAGCVGIGSRTEPLRVVTYNIRHGEGMDRVLDLDRTAAVLRELRPDVVALQEVDCGARRSGGVDQAAQLGEQLGMQHAFGSFMDYQGGQYGCAILSRLPILQVEPLRLPDGNEPRVALRVDVETPNGEVVAFVCVHFDWVDDDRFRFAQASVTADHLASIGGPVVVLGDFNDQPGSRTLALFEAGARAAWSETTPTFPSSGPEIAIDHVFASPAARWTVGRAVVVEEPLASDHRPVLVLLHGPMR